MSPSKPSDHIDWDEGQMRALDCLKQLPHWACVAFAARCVRRAWHAVREHHAGAPMMNHAVENAVVLAEYSARTGQPRPGAEESSRAALMACGETPESQHVAAAAANAALAIAEGPEGSEKGAFLAFNDTIELARQLDDVAMLENLLADLELLLKRCLKEKWDNKTPISEDLLSPIDQPLQPTQPVANVAPVERTRGELGEDEARTWMIWEDVVQWQPGERVAFVSTGLPALYAITGMFLAGAIVGGILRAFTPLGTAGAIAGAVVCGLMAYRLIRGKKKLVSFDWTQETMTMRSGMGKREYAFRDLGLIRVKAFEEESDDETEQLEYSALLEIETADRPLAILHSLCPEEDPVDACEPLETIGQWLAASLDRPYEAAVVDANEPATTDKQLAAQEVALGQVALKKAKLAEHFGSDSDSHVSEAVAHFSEANRLDPANIDSLLEVARLCSDRDDRAQAIAAYSVAIEACPERPDVYCSRAFLYRLDSQYDLAIADYSEAIRLDPENDSIYRSRGNVYTDAGAYADAVADFTKCLELTDASDDNKLLDELRLSERSSILAERADAHRKQGDLQRATVDIRKAIELVPDNPYAQLVQAEVRKAADN